MLLNLWDSGRTDVVNASTSHKEHSFQTSLATALKVARADDRKQSDQRKVRRSGKKKPCFSLWLAYFFEEEKEGRLRVLGQGRKTE